MADTFLRKCPFCAGDMVRSKESSAASINFVPPWTGMFSLSGMKHRAYPWACMGCGVVLFYLDNLPVVASSFKERRESRKLATASAPGKS
jgi:hypothetical protein